MVDDKTEELNYGEVLKDLQSGNPQDMRIKLKSSKFDIDTQDENGFIYFNIGKTILCNMSELHQPNTTPLEPFWIILELFADPNIKDKSGNTALHYAVRNKNKALVLCLMLFGASNEITNDEGKKPFEMTNMGDDVSYINEKINNFKFSFLQLTRKRRNKLRKIFQFLDTDQAGYIAELNMIQFNMWLNEDSENDAREDAKKFIEEASVFKSSTVCKNIKKDIF